MSSNVGKQTQSVINSKMTVFPFSLFFVFIFFLRTDNFGFKQTNKQTTVNLTYLKISARNGSILPTPQRFQNGCDFVGDFSLGHFAGDADIVSIHKISEER